MYKLVVTLEILANTPLYLTNALESKFAGVIFFERYLYSATKYLFNLDILLIEHGIKTGALGEGLN
jgi:hypothetical protein